MYKFICECEAFSYTSNILKFTNWQNNNNDINCNHNACKMIEVNMDQYKTSTVIALLKVWKQTQFVLNSEVCPILADALQDAGYDDESVLSVLRKQVSYADDKDNLAWLEELLGNVPKELIGDDWQQAFQASMPPDAAPPRLEINCNSFCRSDVKSVLFARKGEHDQDNWFVVGELYDGRYFCLRAGCCYTGWNVSSNGTSDVALNIIDLIQYGLEDNERELIHSN